MEITFRTARQIVDRIKAVQADKVLGVKSIQLIAERPMVDCSDNPLDTVEVVLNVDMNKPQDLLFLGYWAHFISVNEQAAL
jgi:hypothetical protein